MESREVTAYIEALCQRKFKGQVVLNMSGNGSVASVKTTEMICNGAPIPGVDPASGVHVETRKIERR